MSVAIVRKRGPVRPDARNVVRGQETRRRILEAARARMQEHLDYVMRELRYHGRRAQEPMTQRVAS